MAQRDLKVSILGQDKTSGAFGSAGGGAAKFGTMAVAAFAAVATAAAGAGVALFKIGESFDSAYDTIRVGTGATGDALGALKDDFRAVVSDVPTDFASASTAIADLNTRTGQTGEPLRQLSKQMLEMTRLTGGDLSTNIASVTRVFGDWGVAVEDQSGTMDYLFKVSQSTGIGIDALSQKVVQFGAPLRQMGFDFETSAAMLGKWEKEGVNTEAVLAGMKIGLGKFSKAGKDPVEAMRSVAEAIKGAGSAGEANMIAIEAFGQRAGPDMAAAIREGRFDLDALMATLKGSKETILGAAADTQDFGEKWTMFKNNVLLALEPIAARVFDAMGVYLDRFSAWWAANGPAIIATATMIGATIATVFGTAGDIVGAMVAHWQSFAASAAVALAVASPVLVVLGAQLLALGVMATISAAQSVAAWVAKAAAAVTSGSVMYATSVKVIAHWVAMSVGATVNAAKVVAGWVLTSAGAIAAGVVMVAQTALHVAKWAFLGAQSLLHAAKVAAAWLIAMGPIGLVIAAVIGVVALIVANWDTIRAKTEELWNAVKAATGAAWDWIKSAVSAGIDFLVGLFLNFTGPGLIIKHWDSIKAATSAAWDAVKGFVSGGVEAVTGFIGSLPGKAAGALSSLASTLSGVARGAWDAFTGAVRGGIDTALGVVQGLAGRVSSAVSGFGSLLVNAGRELMSGLARGIGEKISAVVDKVRAAAQRIKDLLPGSPVKDGPLTSWNNGAAGKRLMGMLAGGIDAASDLPGRAMERAVDFGDLAGMQVGGTAFVNRRLGASPSSAETAPVRPQMSSTDALLAEQNQLLREQNELLRRAPREYLAGQRQMAGAF